MRHVGRGLLIRSSKTHKGRKCFCIECAQPVCLPRVEQRRRWRGDQLDGLKWT